MHFMKKMVHLDQNITKACSEVSHKQYARIALDDGLVMLIRLTDTYMHHLSATLYSGTQSCNYSLFHILPVHLVGQSQVIFK